jgi:hypothetical protein
MPLPLASILPLMSRPKACLDPWPNCRKVFTLLGWVGLSPPPRLVVCTTQEFATSINVGEVCTARVTVLDTDGGQASATTTVTVQSPADAITTADALVQQLSSLNSGQKNGLTSKLDAAQDLITKGNLAGACGNLRDVVSQLNAFVRTGQLSVAEAAPLLGEVQAIQQSLGCS